MKIYIVFREATRNASTVQFVVGKAFTQEDRAVEVARQMNMDARLHDAAKMLGCVVNHTVTEIEVE